METVQQNGRFTLFSSKFHSNIYSILFVCSTSCQNNSVKGNFMKSLSTCLISMALLNQISFETKQKSKYKVDFNFIFILIEK